MFHVELVAPVFQAEPVGLPSAQRATSNTEEGGGAGTLNEWMLLGGGSRLASVRQYDSFRRR
jgi:hypothetical protein